MGFRLLVEHRLRSVDACGGCRQGDQAQLADEACRRTCVSAEACHWFEHNTTAVSDNLVGFEPAFRRPFISSKDEQSLHGPSCGSRPTTERTTSRFSHTSCCCRSPGWRRRPVSSPASRPGDLPGAAPEPAAAAPAPASDRNRARSKKPDPFTFADFTWLNGNSRQHASPLGTTYVTGEFRADVTFIEAPYPHDHTLVGTSESGRTSEVQVQQLGIGGDFHAEHTRPADDAVRHVFDDDPSQ